jgi:hypothetical protein
MRFRREGIIAALAVVAAIVVGPANAADVEFPAPDNAVTVRGVTTYLDLARHFVPDIKNTGNGYVGSRHIDIRHIAGQDFEATDGDTFGFYDISSVKLKADGEERLLVLFDFAQASSAAQGLAVLALYDVSGVPVLLDAADVGLDQSTYFFDQALVPVGGDANVVLTMSTHFNSSQTYNTQTMIMLRDDRLERIDEVTLLGDRNCGVERQQSISYAANPAEGKPYAPVKVTVADVKSAVEEVCADLDPATLGKKQIKVTYVWNAGQNKYLPDSDAIAKLEAENETRF